MIGMMHAGRMAMAPERVAVMAVPTVVAFTDPNDLLSIGFCLHRTVIGLIAHGHKVGGPLPEAQVVASSQCF